MSRLKYILINYKNPILLSIFCLAVVLGYYVSLYVFDFLTTNTLLSKGFANFISLFSHFLTLALITYPIASFLFNIEERALIKSKKEIEDGYPNFVKSIVFLEDVQELPFFLFEYTRLYRFIYLDFYIELKLTKVNTFEIIWKKKDTHEFVSSRTILYKIEPTIQATLGNGPYYSVKLNFWSDSKMK